MRVHPSLCSIVTALCLTAGAQPAQSPAQAETNIVSYIDANRQAANALLEKIVNINSGTHNLEGVRAVAEVMKSQFSVLGFQVQWIPMEQVQRAGVLVATHRCPAGAGKCGKRILLIGHMDTVFEKTSPFQKYSANGNIATGPGVNDMKGGLVDMVFALKALKAAGVLDRMEITAVLSGDEEAHGEPASISRRDMIARTRRMRRIHIRHLFPKTDTAPTREQNPTHFDRTAALSSVWSIQE